jgi:Tol biopolymer transport system component
VDITSGSVLRTFPAKGQGAGVSPDGRYVVFGDGYPRGLRLLTISLATGETREFLPLSPESQARFTSMAWTPDSRSVVFYGRLRGDEGMWLVPIDGRSPHKIEVAIKPIAAWQFSPKTSQVAFTTALESRLEMWKMEHFLPAARTSDR